MDRPTIIVTRRARAKGEDWRGARSHFGGLPRLGGTAWPRDAGGEPLHLLAQIDCAEVSKLAPGTLPDSGALCFFAGGSETWEGKVLYIADPSTETIRPKGRPFRDVNGELFPANPTPDAKPLAPYWPIEFIAVPAHGGVSDPELQKVVHRDLPKRQFFYHLSLVNAPGAEEPFYYNSVTVRHFIECLRSAQLEAPARIATWEGFAAKSYERMTELKRPSRSWVGWLMGGGANAEEDKAILSAEKNYGRQRDKVDRMLSQQGGFDFFVEEAAAYSAEVSLAPMTDEQFNRFSALHSRAHKEFGGLTAYHLPRLQELASAAHCEMMASPDVAMNAALPDDVRAYMNTHCRLASSGWHQMFGRGTDIQSAAAENEDNILLLQLLYDDIIGWKFGDMGACQYWIAPEASAKHRFLLAISFLLLTLSLFPSI